MSYLKIILLIATREFKTRVRKKSFIGMTLLGPVLFGAFMVGPIWLSTRQTEKISIQILDQSGYELDRKLMTYTDFHFVSTPGDEDYIKQVFFTSDHEGLLIIPKMQLDKPSGIVYFSKVAVDPSLQSKLERIIKTEIQNTYLRVTGINQEFLQNIWNKMQIKTISIQNNETKDSFAEANAAAGLTGAICIYFFIFLYGIQVLRSVLEEKTNRIVELLITSVAPFQLMSGKLLGIALLALLQFLIWLILTTGIAATVSALFEIDRFSDKNFTLTMKKIDPAHIHDAVEMHRIVSAISSLDFTYLLLCFSFYFLFGYLLYGALFAAIGAASDSETDTQQFIFPVTLPLILSIAIAQSIITQPNSSFAVGISIFPLTSPITMMVRLPFGVPWQELLLSMCILVISIVFFVWLSARIYSVGILMYGKKITYHELWRWIRYSKGF